MRTRREILGAHFMTKMPPLVFGHLFRWWDDIGRYEIATSGIIPLTFQEIEAWSNVSGTVFVEDEAQIIKNLSCAYVSMYNQAKKRDCPAPYTPEMTKGDLEAASRKTAEQMRKLKGASNG